jgi:hypothetical protein
MFAAGLLLFNGKLAANISISITTTISASVELVHYTLQHL